MCEIFLGASGNCVFQSRNNEGGFLSLSVGCIEILESLSAPQNKWRDDCVSRRKKLRHLGGDSVLKRMSCLGSKCRVYGFLHCVRCGVCSETLELTDVTDDNCFSENLCCIGVIWNRISRNIVWSKSLERFGSS
ncbi:hypothetical protein NPIL_437261 [Nephila pilipes]|uniref:Uncharacterized protein n=1 Tax=Nephila pilipes TaxID=299642 RepID=A0A8X6UDG3_NEPPI|nr:hypothetical protein NPIL_437261 [Nephila pilipes]